MKTNVKMAMLLLSTSLSAAAAYGETARIFIPEGSADSIRIIDATSGKNAGRITGTEAVHGLAGSANSPYLVAGSYMEIDRKDAADSMKPAAVSDDEHAAHHSKPKQSFGPADAGVSLLSVIDAASGELLRKIEVPGAVHHVAIAPDGRFAVSTHPNGDGVSVVDLESFELVAWIPTGAMPNYAVFGNDPSVVYVSNTGNGTISEVDLARGIVLRNMVVGETPEHLAVNPEANRVYVADADAGDVIELDLSEGRLSRRFELGGEIHGLDLSDDRDSLLVAGKGTDHLFSVDLASGAVTANALAPSPYHLMTIPGTGSVMVSSREEPKVWIVDSATLTTKQEIPIAGEGHQMVAVRH